MRRLVLGTTLLALVAVAPAAHADPQRSPRTTATSALIAFRDPGVLVVRELL